MSFEDEAKEATDAVNKFLDKAKEECLYEFQRTLQHISKLPFWLSWRSSQMAEEALHWGAYWDKGFPGNDTSPKTLLAYYLRLLKWKIFGGSR
jgi:hypothetical protein